jgi:hypothetical protein
MLSFKLIVPVCAKAFHVTMILFQVSRHTG